MLDPKIIKEKPQIIKNMLKSRSMDFDLDGLVESDQKRREYIIKTDELRKKKSSCTRDCTKKEDGRRCNHDSCRDEKCFSRLGKIRRRARTD